MANISWLCDELLIKILSFLPTKVAVSTSVLSKQWEFLWMWLPKLEYITDSEYSKLTLRDFINKNLHLHRAPVIESLHLQFNYESTVPEDMKRWVGTAVSRCIRELSIHHSVSFDDVSLPSSLYTCKSLVALKLKGDILVDVPQTVSLPSLKTCHLRGVKYLNGDSLRLLLSHCPVLEELTIRRVEDDNVGALVVIVPSLLRLSLLISRKCSSDRNVIVTPSLKCFSLSDYRNGISYLVEQMPNLKEADIFVLRDIEKLLVPITSVKRLSLRVYHLYLPPGLVFNQLELLRVYVLRKNYSSKLLVRLLKLSPKLRVFKVLRMYNGQTTTIRLSTG